MKNFFMFALFALLLFQAGCTKSIRYSHYEIKDFPPSVQEHIKSGEIETGMTRLQVRYSWGGPDSIRVLVPSKGETDKVEWVYKKYSVFKTRLIFTDDKLTEIISNDPGFRR